MKTSSATNIGIRKKAIEHQSINLKRFLAKATLVSVCLILLYNSLYLWSIAILLVSFGAMRIYRLYRELNDIDWSIDMSDLTMEDVMDDLENR